MMARTRARRPRWHDGRQTNWRPGELSGALGRSLGLALLMALACLAWAAPLTPALAAGAQQSASSQSSHQAQSARPADSGRPTEAVAYARIAVVRVLTYYYGKVNDGAPIFVSSPCAADGALIGTTGSNLNSYNYVLTPTAAVNPITPCGGVQTAFQQLYGNASSWGISKIDVVLNAAYTGVGSSQLGSVTFTVSPGSITSIGSATGPQLLALALAAGPNSPTHDMPTLELPQPSDTPANPAAATVFDLTGHDGQPLGRDSLLVSEINSTLYPVAFPASQVGQQLSPSATPTPLATPNGIGGTVVPTTTSAPTSVATPTALAGQLSLGAPEIDSNGRLIGMVVADPTGAHVILPTATLKSIIGGISGASGPLMSQWQQGLTDFYANPPKYSAANSTFTGLLKSYPDFGGVSAFITATSQQTTTIPPLTVAPSATPTPTPSTSPNTSSGLSTTTLALLGGGALVVLLALIALLLVIRRRNAQARAAIQAEYQARLEEEAGLDLLPEDASLDDLDHYTDYNARPGDQPGRMPAAPGRMTLPPEAALPGAPRGMSQGMARQDFVSGAPGPQSMPRDMSQGMARGAMMDGAAAAGSAAMGGLEPPMAPGPQSMPRPSQGPQSMPRPSQGPQPVRPPAMSDEVPTAILAARDPAPARKGAILTPMAAGATDPGVKRANEPNQDNILAVQGFRMAAGRPQPYGLFIVADGMGGHLNGQEASRLTIEIVARTVMQPLTTALPLDDASLNALLVDGVQRANAELQERNRSSKSDMGTTITAALVVDDRAYIINVGDSRTYVLSPDAGLRQITSDHSVVASLVTAGVIKPEDVYTHPRRNQIYRSLGGDDAAVEVDSFSVTLQAGDKLLLCSDGLWEMVHDPQIAAILRGAADPKQAVELLTREANTNGGEDNIGVIVVRMLEGAPHNAQVGAQIVAAPQNPAGAEAQQTH